MCNAETNITFIDRRQTTVEFFLFICRSSLPNLYKQVVMLCYDYITKISCLKFSVKISSLSECQQGSVETQTFREPQICYILYVHATDHFKRALY